MEKNRSWCPIPWLGVSLRNNGDYRVCCHSNTSESRGLLRGEDHVVHNARIASVDEVRNSPLLKEIRRAMLRGERHATCVRCNLEDDAGARSRRFYEGEIWKETFNLGHAKSVTEEDGSIDPSGVAPEFLDLRFGNKCNLKCRMCGPTDSTLWYQEHFDTVGPHFHDSIGKVRLEKTDNRVSVAGEDPYRWHESATFWEQIEGRLQKIRRIHTVGGEPMLIERHYELLQKLIDSGRSKTVIMDYNSNVTVVSPRALELWKEFKEVRIGMSVDGVGAINDYIRAPSRWSTIERNLETLDKTPGNFLLWLATTVQLYNVYYLPDLLKWKIGKNFARINNSDELPFVTAHPLHTPKHFSTRALPPAVKTMVAKRFDDFFENWFLPFVHDPAFPKERRENWIFRMRSLLGGHRELMFREDLSHLLPQFWEATRRMDRYRGENFLEAMPEIAVPIQEELRKQGRPEAAWT